MTRAASSELCVYQCVECHSIIADSMCALKFAINEESVVFSVTGVSEHVVEEKKMLLSSYGNDAGCVYVSVSCRCGGNVLGRKYIATIPHLDTIRNQYCLFRKNLYRYTLGSRREESGDSQPENRPLEVTDDIYLIKCALVKFNSMVCKIVELLKNKGIIEDSELEDFDFRSGTPPLLKESESGGDPEHTDSGRSSLLDG